MKIAVVGSFIVFISESDLKVAMLNGFFALPNYCGHSMETRVSPSAISVILLLMAATSLMIMLSLYQINYMVHGDLYNFGLQFSYRWAMPYWILSGIIFGLSWTNIALSIVFTLYIQKKSRRKAGSLAPTQAEKAEAEVQKAEEKEQRTISEFIETQKQDLSLKEETPREKPVVEMTGNVAEVVETASEQETQAASQETEHVGQIAETQKVRIEEKESGQGQSVL